MGKRKERRLAALSNAGRRVKLDLFAEPSGDLGGSSVNNEVGGDIDPTQCAGLPNSPSSSENSPADCNGEEVLLGEGKHMVVNAVDDPTAQEVEQQDRKRDSMSVDVSQSMEGGDARESDATASADAFEEKHLAEQPSVAGTSNAQVIGDVSLGWRMVMHEESNQCYYWNIETGETSWEIPAVLAQLPQSGTADVGTNMSTTTLGVGLDNSSSSLSVGTHLFPLSTEVHGNSSQMHEWVEGYKSESLKDKNWVSDGQQSEWQNNLSAANPFPGDGSSVVSDYTQDAVANDHSGIDLSTSLIKQCESLLERMGSLQGYGSQLQGQDQMLKYTLEVEIRLSDIKSLSTYGSSLLPFWAHCERQLKQLEDVVNNKIYQLAVSAQMDDDVEATTDDSVKEKEQSRENFGAESEADARENSVKSEVSPVSTSFETDSHNVVHSSSAPSRSPSRHLEGGIPATEDLNGTTHQNTEFQPDMDMDVDMEVEEGEFHPLSTTILGDASSAKDFAPIEKLIEPHPPAEHLSLLSEDAATVPPPPEEEWIPPPPPDNDPVPPPPPDSEQIPPPPPGDPPECLYPPLPSYSQTGQPLPYTEQYNLSYPHLNFPFYGQTPTGNFYGNTDGSQAAVSHPSLYYGAIPNTYVETATVMVGSIDPEAYYNVQDGSIPPMPVVSGVESSVSHIESGSLSYGTLASDQTRTGDAAVQELNLKLVGSTAVVESDLATKVVPSTLITSEDPASAGVKDAVSASSADSVTTNVVPTGTKVQTKVSRKKRNVIVAPSLRSNKKVSRLVDKWKAAKEELHENEDDEPESAYEILEKKRQREIKEWHDKQIASGEAKDNANFQPLGGDWRARVKRRRAQAAKEASETPPEVPTDENKQPDLEEHSRDLPSGWQAYWDDSSKQVYYGNAITSETTWTKPTK